MLRKTALSSCPHRPPCPGCPRYGERGIAPAAATILHEIAAAAAIEEPVLHEGGAAGFRHRARLAVRGRARSPKIGLFQTGTHRIVDIPRCRVHHPVVNRVAAAVKDAIRATGIAPYADATHRGLVRYLQVVVERSSRRAQVVLVGNDDRPDSLAPLREALEPTLGTTLHSLWWNGNPERTNTILGPHWFHWAGPDAVREQINDVDVFFPPGAFGQSHLDLAERIALDVAAHAAGATRIVELYAGCGALGLGLVRRGAHLAFNERSEDGLAGLRMGLGALPADLRTQATIHAGSAADHADLLHGTDLAIVDPPRKGLDPEIIEAVIRSDLRRLVYVSCNPESLRRDLAALVAPGSMRLTHLAAYALFPYTEHVEALAVLDR